MSVWRFFYCAYNQDVAIILKIILRIMDSYYFSCREPIPLPPESVNSGSLSTPCER